ncbi:MAG: copper-binding protein [Rubrivivax sp.]
MAYGEVRKVDKEQGRVRLKHSPIASLEMPAITRLRCRYLRSGSSVSRQVDPTDG